MDNAMAIAFCIIIIVLPFALLELLTMVKLVLLVQLDRYGVETIVFLCVLEDKFTMQDQILAFVQVVLIGMEWLALLAQEEQHGIQQPIHVNVHQDLILMAIFALLVVLL